MDKELDQATSSALCHTIVDELQRSELTGMFILLFEEGSHIGMLSNVDDATRRDIFRRVMDSTNPSVVLTRPQ